MRNPVYFLYVGGADDVSMVLTQLAIWQVQSYFKNGLPFWIFSKIDSKYTGETYRLDRHIFPGADFDFSV